ncbi:MAG: lysophospholipid acyltransferase family protein [Candidatus Omnitrophota bacterium]
MLYVIIRAIAVVLYKILFRLEAYGRENIPRQGGFILASNHASHIDPPLLAAASPRKVAFIAKEELFDHPFAAWFLRGLNAFPVKLKAADIKSMRESIRRLKIGEALAIFPEGRRSENGELDKPLGGIGLIAARSGVPIVPAYIEGSIKALPRGTACVRPIKIRVYFGKPFRIDELKSTAERRREHYYAIAALTMRKIAQIKEGLQTQATKK